MLSHVKVPQLLFKVHNLSFFVKIPLIYEHLISNSVGLSDEVIFLGSITHVRWNLLFFGLPKGLKDSHIDPAVS